MSRIEVSLGPRSYAVDIGHGAIRNSDALRRHTQGRTVLVVSNSVVAPLYLDRVRQALCDAQLQELILPDGEHEKNTENWRRVIDRLVEIRAGRDACLVTLGGGVTGDLGGFAAATYMRGIDFIQIPTTLLAQVDASVGGKTAINHAEGKNLVGAFHQPLAVVADTETLESLPQREFRAGLAEVVKCGAIRDRDLLDWLAEHQRDILQLDPDRLVPMIESCVRHKAEVVIADEREAGERALLNFGHSFGHALERVTAYREFLHGEAVSIGMVIAATLSEARAVCPAGVSEGLKNLLTGFGLPVSVPAKVQTPELLEAMALDKKNLQGKLRLILLRDAGAAIIDSASTAEQVCAAIEACRS